MHNEKNLFISITKVFFIEQKLQLEGDSFNLIKLIYLAQKCFTLPMYLLLPYLSQIWLRHKDFYLLVINLNIEVFYSFIAWENWISGEEKERKILSFIWILWLLLSCLWQTVMFYVGSFQYKGLCVLFIILLGCDWLYAVWFYCF